MNPQLPEIPEMVVAASETSAAIVDSWHGRRIGDQSDAEAVYAACEDVDGMVGLWMFATWLAIAAEILHGEAWRDEGRSYIEDVHALAACSADKTRAEGRSAIAEDLQSAADLVKEALKED